MKVVTVLGARPQFIKASPLSRRLREDHQEILVHTGQHYDPGMSAVFFDELDIPQPDYHLGIGSGSHGAQTGAMLEAVEQVLVSEHPDLVLVYGDTNSTLAGALAAAKLHLPVAHVEAGLRSFNRAMPEEINRVLTDHLATWLFAPSSVAQQHLANEGIADGVHVVGDIMVDAMYQHRARAEERSTIQRDHGLAPGAYYLATIHRAENTDHPELLAALLRALSELDRQVVLPLHPRTRARAEQFGLPLDAGSLRAVEPVGYLDMLQLQRGAACIITDSGGVQKEAYLHRVPCVTLRAETEWTETVDAGWNVLAGTDPLRIREAVRQGVSPDRAHPDFYGDGSAADRIVAVLSSGARPA